ncbi:hypothetical protein Godav_003947, partial [Gossypium davidsonii]|nr:hypothetical protein [Gossypium davidsonii]
MKEKIGDLSFQNYRPTKKNVYVIDPTSNKDVHFLKYPIYVGGNKGHSIHVYPLGLTIIALVKYNVYN